MVALRFDKIPRFPSRLNPPQPEFRDIDRLELNRLNTNVCGKKGIDRDRLNPRLKKKGSQAGSLRICWNDEFEFTHTHTHAHTHTHTCTRTNTHTTHTPHTGPTYSSWTHPTRISRKEGHGLWWAGSTWHSCHRIEKTGFGQLKPDCTRTDWQRLELNRLTPNFEWQLYILSQLNSKTCKTKEIEPAQLDIMSSLKNSQSVDRLPVGLHKLNLNVETCTVQAQKGSKSLWGGYD